MCKSCVVRMKRYFGWTNLTLLTICQRIFFARYVGITSTFIFSLTIAFTAFDILYINILQENSDFNSTDNVQDTVSR